MALEVNSKEFDDFVNRFAKEFEPFLKGLLGAGLDLISVEATGRHMINPGGKGKPVNDSRVTTRSGRLARSFLPQGGAFKGGQREQERTVKSQGGQIVAEMTSRVPYFLAHELGAEFTKTPTDKQRSMAWAKFYAEGDDKWKYMALAKQWNMKIEARPILTPAVESAQENIFKIYERELDRFMEGFR